MAKNTHAQEVSTGGSASFTEDELNDPIPPPVVVITRMNLGGEVSSPVNREDGTDSSTSSETGQNSSGLQNPAPQQPAPTTANPSPKTPGSQVDSSAGSISGDTPKTGTESADPFDVAAEEVIPEEDDESEEEESTEDTEPKVTAPKPAPRGRRTTTRKPAGGNPKAARVRSTDETATGDEFDF